MAPVRPVVAGLAALALWTPSAPAPAQPAAAVQPAVPAAPATVVLKGLDGAATPLDLTALARLPRQRVVLTHMGRTSTYAGPLLADVLRQADAPLGNRLHGAAVATIVLLTAADGYAVALSLGELDPALRPGARVILADREDDRPLPPDEAPLRLVIDGDSRPARDVHSIQRIEVRRLP